MKTASKYAFALALMAQFACGQKSPAEQAAVSIGGKNIGIKYSAPSVRGRQIFGDGGVVSHDHTYPVWRAGANQATAYYTLFVLVKDPDAWELIISKQTGQWGLTYKPDQDLGRVKMAMSKPAALVETLKYTLADEGGNKARLTLEWENHVASVPIMVK
jgi:hypothetical protein